MWSCWKAGLLVVVVGRLRLPRPCTFDKGPSNRNHNRNRNRNHRAGVSARHPASCASPGNTAQCKAPPTTRKPAHRCAAESGSGGAPGAPGKNGAAAALAPVPLPLRLVRLRASRSPLLWPRLARFFTSLSVADRFRTRNTTAATRRSPAAKGESRRQRKSEAG